MKLKSFEIINHGVDHSQYFQGCGTAFTPYTHVFTGCGNDAKEAYEDALEQAFMAGDPPREVVEQLPRRPRGINKRMKVPARAVCDDVHYYVSIRVEVTQ